MVEQKPPKIKVLVLGAAGMLGSELVKALYALKVETIACTRADGDVLAYSQLHALDELHSPDLVINCAGVINAGHLVNSLGPWNVSQAFSCVIWNISTDCVFNSSKPYPYRHSILETPVPVTEYGHSKLLGEIISPQVVNIRTSFIGYRHGLLAWFMNLSPDSAIDGWRGALWSGSTVYEVAATLAWAAYENQLLSTTQHLASIEPITKFNLLVMLRDRFRRDSIILRVVDEPKINRAMAPTMPMRSIGVAIEAMPYPAIVVVEALA